MIDFSWLLMSCVLFLKVETEIYIRGYKRYSIKIGHSMHAAARQF